MNKINKSLGRSLVVNAMLSFITGILLTIFPEKFDRVLSLDLESLLKTFGVALILHGIFLILASRQTRVSMWVGYNLIAIGPYPVLLVLLVLFGIFDNVLAVALVLFDAVAVGAVALWQFTLWRSFEAQRRLS